ncbi:MAG: MBL fold metallo-hydrolase, partial [Spirochaetaceae bacterium]|nr:MBL fold metallo-hydrolase [Spirochaetaceae bacterium]
NSYLVGNDETKEALIVDPAEMDVSLLGQIEKNGYSLRTVLVTHNHSHHVRGLKTLLKIYDAAVFAGNAQVLGYPCRPVRDGESFLTCGLTIDAFSVPGHSPDSIVYRIDRLLFTGDALHAGLIGRTLSAYNATTLVDRLRDRVLNQADECLVLPGHGPPSTLGTERRFNVGLEPGYSERIQSRYDLFV